MPWKECHVEDERLRFVARLLDGEKMARAVPRVRDLAEDRLQDLRPLRDCGVEGLTDRSRRPYRHANRLPMVDREADRAAEAGISRAGARRRFASGCGSAAASSSARRSARCTPCSIGMAWSRARPPPRRGRTARPVAADHAERAVVCRLQGRVHARRSAILLSADDHRLRQPVPDHL